MITDKEKIKKLLDETRTLKISQASDVLMIVTGWMSLPEYEPDFWEGMEFAIEEVKKESIKV